MKSLFEGVCPALVTPFCSNKVDFVALGKLINHVVSGGVSAIAILATTGEGSTIKPSERKEVIEFSKKVIDGRCKLIVGSGHNDMVKAASLVRNAKKLGADGALVVTPYYNKTTQKGIVEYYKKLSKIGLPIIAYNVPSRTGLNIELDTIKELLKLDNIYGIKESTSDINRIIKLMSICRSKIAVYSGEDSLNYIFYTMGGKGAVSVTANILPNIVCDIYKASKNKDFDKAYTLQNKLVKVNELMFCETNPTPVKEALSVIGICKNTVRAPLINVSAKNSKIIKKEIDRLVRANIR